MVNQVVPLSNGQMMITGDIATANNTPVPAVRLNSDGTLDPSFDASSFERPRDRLVCTATGWRWWAVIMSSPAIMIPPPLKAGVGIWPASPTTAPWTPASARAIPAHVQTTDGRIEDLLLQPDGKIVVSGGFSHVLDGTGTCRRAAPSPGSPPTACWMTPLPQV